MVGALSLTFVAPYVAVLAAFALYPTGYALWMGSDPRLYADLLRDPRYVRAVVNTVLFAGVAVNVQMVLALLLSGFFVRRRWWIKPLLVVYLLPWTLPAVQTSIAIHWMLASEDALVGRVCSVLFGIDSPLWFNHWWSAFAANVLAYVWRWMPFWTAIFIAGRMRIPQDVSDAATVDGASGPRGFVHITVPLLANLYILCTLLSTLWTVGEFTTVYFVSGGAPVWTTDVLTTLGFRYAFDFGSPALGVAAVMSMLPLLALLAVVLMRRLHTRALQL
jgi:multiple sugar transport system permease protein